MDLHNYIFNLRQVIHSFFEITTKDVGLGEYHLVCIRTTKRSSLRLLMVMFTLIF